MFATNGRAYVKQLATKSGIWFWNARTGEAPRPLAEWFSPRDLEERLEQQVGDDFRAVADRELGVTGLRPDQEPGIDAVAEARVHLAMPEASVFLRDNATPSASVVVKLQGGRALSEAQVASIVNLVASSVPGMKPESVTIVDQMGGLLSKRDGAGSGGTRNISGTQRRAGGR